LANLFGGGASTSGVTTPIIPTTIKAEGTPVPEAKPAFKKEEADFSQEDEAVRIWQDEIQRLNVELKNSDLAQ
jgi:hypothetical protein